MMLGEVIDLVSGMAMGEQGEVQFPFYIICGVERLSNEALPVQAMPLLHPKEVPLCLTGTVSKICWRFCTGTLQRKLTRSHSIAGALSMANCQWDSKSTVWATGVGSLPWWKVLAELKKFSMSTTIPGLRDDPKIVGRDDTKVVGDSVAKAVPFFGNSSPKEAQDCRSELGEGFIASIIGDMFVHYAPASFDRIKMRTIGRDEVQPDPASRLPQPLTHQNRVVVGGVVKKDVDPFLDNATYHHAILVREWLGQPGRRIRLHFIPSYCPHLDPIER